MEKQIKRLFKKMPTWQKVVLLVIVFAISFYIKSNRVIAGDEAYLVSCIDGDTAQLRINGVKERVRFIAVDAPELSSNDFYAHEAAKHTCNALNDAKIIRVEYDPESDQRDKYGRVIAWVYVDGELLQRSLVEGGYAKVRYVYGDYLFVDELNRLQSQAKKGSVGLWK